MLESKCYMDKVSNRPQLTRNIEGCLLPMVHVRGGLGSSRGREGGTRLRFQRCRADRKGEEYFTGFFKH